MRKNIVLLAMFIAASAQVSAQCGDSCGCDKAACCSCCKCSDTPKDGKWQGRHDRERRRGAYFKDDFNVYYNGDKIPNASANTFVELGHGYAKDAFCVYFRGRKLADASPNTFEIMADGYARDAFNTYYRGKKIN